MDPFSLHTERLVLDQPMASDVEDIARYCTGPEFERFMTTPWPYERGHAEFFVDEHVPSGWASGAEWTWAIREAGDEHLLGVVGVRMKSGMVGYWLGEPHRGRGLMPEALGAVIDAVFEHSDWSEVRWECVVGNTSSMRVAEKVGFRFTGEALGIVPGRDGSLVASWTARLGREDGQVPRPGWPE